jgi:hypothetical protein
LFSGRERMMATGEVKYFEMHRLIMAESTGYEVIE